MNIFKFAAVILAALIIGRWFKAELDKAIINKEPWYTAYLSIPGLIIILAILSPIIYKIILRFL
ncbi:MAG: hypothetical protein HN737_05820 [Desulfobacterales bacterium]|jgi:hypothetical protein|nr:hypothetical protein [Desulfobacteraceae bacterium]MBT4364546.1 hypothetical protein [Desulfobacteraceae bacterium]MBT7085942.1 hypothetical protein [Desulfobacterales bacterium]MBT7696908.1 hypothetical protein [Desulfobacterales bacterium]